MRLPRELRLEKGKWTIWLVLTRLPGPLLLRQDHVIMTPHDRVMSCVITPVTPPSHSHYRSSPVVTSMYSNRATKTIFWEGVYKNQNHNHILIMIQIKPSLPNVFWWSSRNSSHTMSPSGFPYKYLYLAARSPASTRSPADLFDVGCGNLNSIIFKWFPWQNFLFSRM